MGMNYFMIIIVPLVLFGTVFFIAWLAYREIDKKTEENEVSSECSLIEKK
jgi:hypothetical protein